MKKLYTKIEKILNTHCLFFLVLILFGNYFAIEYSLSTETILSIHYIHLFDAAFGLLMVIVTAVKVYREFVEEENGKND